MPFNKPLPTWTLEDLQGIVANQQRETVWLEFKKELSGKKGEPAWNQDCKLGENAKKAVCKEIVALANSKGGYLILGIEETDDKPRRAKAINPIPKCSELADKLMQTIGDTVEPKLINLLHTVIPTDELGNGVLVFFIPKSPHAPHRSMDKDCYIRHGEESKPMSMDEIQRHAIRVEREQFDGLWTASFSFSVNEEVVNMGGGVVILDRGRLFGGDSGMYYHGYYNIVDDQLIAQIKVVHYYGAVSSVWGDNEPEFHITAHLAISPDKKIMKGIMKRTGFAPANDLTLVWREHLPSMRD